MATSTSRGHSFFGLLLAYLGTNPYNGTATQRLMKSVIELGQFLLTDTKFLDRFWKKVDKREPDECWPWKASKTYEGYGQIKLPKSRDSVKAHRVSFFLYNNFIDERLVCHSCDNPVCVNPKHLFLGTDLDNVRDMIKKNRKSEEFLKYQQPGENNSYAKLTEKDVIEIKDLIKNNFNNCEIAEIYNVTHSNISSIRRNKTWKHLNK